MCANMGTRSHMFLSAGGTGSMNWGPVDLVLVNVPKKTKLLEALGVFGRIPLPEFH